MSIARSEMGSQYIPRNGAQINTVFNSLERRAEAERLQDQLLKVYEKMSGKWSFSLVQVLYKIARLVDTTLEFNRIPSVSSITLENFQSAINLLSGKESTTPLSAQEIQLYAQLILLLQSDVATMTTVFFQIPMRPSAPLEEITHSD